MVTFDWSAANRTNPTGVGLSPYDTLAASAAPSAAPSPSGFESALLASDIDSLRLQETIFTGLSLVLVGVFLTAEVMLSRYLGFTRSWPTALLIVALAVGTAELIWLRAATLTSSAIMRVLIWLPIVLNTALVTGLLVATEGDDTQYYVLMTVPVLAAAFRLRFGWTVAVIAVADFLNFFSAWWLSSVGEYLEAGAVSLIFAVVGITAWVLVNNLRERETRLEHARERLVIEEKLSAVGRLSSAIAHEIRNPVAMISSSLAMAARPELADTDRHEMLGIAAAEASRLERLTSDFLAYARPRAAELGRVQVSDMLNYVLSIARAHAIDRGVQLQAHARAGLEADVDVAQMHQALLNLVLNAIDACRDEGPVTLSAHANRGALTIDVINPGGPVPPEAAAHLFEPFFTTKPGGTGLGLAIARNIARLHGGELTLSDNRPGRVCFSMTIPAHGCAATGSRVSA